MPRRMPYLIEMEAPVAALYDNVTSREYWEKLVDVHRPNAPESELTDFSSDHTGTDVTVTHSLFRHTLPAIAAAVVPVTLVVTRRQHFDPFDPATSSATGHYIADVPAAPVDFGGRYLLSATPTGSRLRLDSECRVDIPLIGGKVEELILAGIRSLFDAEREFTAEWVESHY